MEVEKGKDGTRQKIGNWGGPCSMNEMGALVCRKYVPTGSDNKIPDMSGTRGPLEVTVAHIENPLKRRSLSPNPGHRPLKKAR